MHSRISRGRSKNPTTFFCSENSVRHKIIVLLAYCVLVDLHLWNSSCDDIHNDGRGTAFVLCGFKTDDVLPRSGLFRGICNSEEGKGIKKSWCWLYIRHSQSIASSGDAIHRCHSRLTRARWSAVTNSFCIPAGSECLLPVTIALLWWPQWFTRTYISYYSSPVTWIPFSSAAQRCSPAATGDPSRASNPHAQSPNTSCIVSLDLASLLYPYSPTPLDLPHVNDTPNAASIMHIVERLVDARQVLAVGNELVNLQLAIHVILDKAAHLRATLDTAESAALPDTAGDELKCLGQC